MKRSTENLRLETFHLPTPLKEEDLRRLRPGDIVYLSGLIFTGRLGVYRKLFEQNVPPPIDLASRCNVTFHCSPAVRESSPGHYAISSVTGTASFRFAKWVGLLLERHGVKAVIGKGGMSEEDYAGVFRAHGAVYLTTVGYGLGALYGRGIRRVAEVFWREELGLAQAMWVLDVAEMGPLIVDCDARGQSLQSLVKGEVDRVFLPLRDSFPAPALKRLGEVCSADQEVVEG